ncbi:isochorismate synthase [Sinomicrobium oceani]|uniref:isochorismate synthase n=1 Tax=Sinomicrobium oceani TaxID=1150368 RepID=A0A1K1QF78_9FLAO|nr:chorismate-binding protein [Sinomicrobium oceani]SFW58592.1 isochorismate synthase [Sinomicrobium oceani]
MTDLSDFFEIIQQHYERGLPFVAYRKSFDDRTGKEEQPGLLKALLQHDDRVFRVRDFSERGFVFSPFDQRKDTLLIPYTESRKMFAVLPVKPKTDAPDKASDIQDCPEQEARELHLQLVRKGVEAIRHGKLKKVVLSRTEEIRIDGEKPIAVFRRLLEHYPDAFCYIWYHPVTGLWLGATPETLLHIKGCVLHTMALAGTQKFRGTTKVDWGEKEKQEQQVVTDAIVDSLRFRVNSLKISAAETHRAGNLLHIKTDIQASLIDGYKKENIASLLNSLHPTPAVCGFPKEEAKRFILENEGYDRSFYSGFLGELHTAIVPATEGASDNTDSALYVNLRCMQLGAHTASLYIGGGITRDSDPKSEWEETCHKAQTMKKILLRKP